MFNKSCYLLAIGFGVGNSKIAPGTVGTLLLGVPFAIGLSVMPLFYSIVVLLVLTVVSIFICTQAEIYMNQHDPGSIILDEVIGFGYAVLLLPNELVYWLLAFLLFRFFDITKPIPINKLQDLPRGYGVVLDDVLAGIYTSIILAVISHFV